MGAIADGFVAYAQPLLDMGDGTVEDMNRAMGLAQMCFNLALLPVESRLEQFNTMQRELSMNDEEFAQFRGDLLEPMIRRHEEMFPLMHRQTSGFPLDHDDSFTGVPLTDEYDAMEEAAPKPSTTAERYAPCPCGSGKKYKFCCGKKPR